MKFTYLNNLQFRVAIVFLVVSTIPLGIAGWFSIHTADWVLTSIVTNQLQNVASDKQALLQRWIAERRADLAVVARSSILRSLDPRQIEPYLALVQGQYAVYHRFVVTNAAGRTVFDSGGGTEEPAESLPGQSSAGEVATISNVTWDTLRQEAVFQIAEPIGGSGEARLGVVRATVSTQAIVAQVLDVSLGRTGECYLVDHAGTFLAHKEPERILQENIAQSGSFANIFSGPQTKPIYTDYRGIPVLGASRGVVGTPWYVVVEQDRDEAFASSSRMARQITVVVAATAVCAVALSWVLASYVTSPIRALSEAAHALSRGDFERAMEVRAKRADEIGALDAAFHHMAGQIREQHARLEQRIGLTEEELHRAEEKLKTTLQAAAKSERLAALGRLAAGVAHEIRTPLTSMKLFLQSLHEDVPLSADQAEDFDVAMRQVHRMESTINHFLNFARPQEPSFSSVDFRKLVDDALVVVKPRANQQEVEVRHTIAADLPSVQGDVRQLNEALVNLLVNALEMMPDGGKLGISVAADSPERNATGWRWVRIEVSDNGPGIPEGALERLFEPFFTTKATGSGLGLAIVQGTVERHGGTIAVRSRAGAGTTFSICLPARDP